MAKGDVTLKFDANTADYLQKVLAATEALRAHGNAARDTGEKVAKVGDHAEGMVHKMTDLSKEMVGLLGVPLSIMGAIELAFKAAEAAMERTYKKAEEFSNRTITLEQSLAKTGQMGDRWRVSVMIKRLAEENYGGRIFDEGAVTKRFAQVHNLGGGRTTIAADYEGVQSALQGGAGKMSPEDAASYGSSVANMAMLMPGMSREYRSRLALHIQTNAPGILSDPKTLGAIARSHNPAETAKFFEAGYAGFQPGKKLIGVEDAINLEASPSDLRGMGHEDRRRYRALEALRHTDADVRMSVLLNPHAYLPAEQANAAQAILAGESRLRDPGSIEQFMLRGILNEGEDGGLVRIGQNIEAKQKRFLERNGASAQNQKNVIEQSDLLFKEQNEYLSQVPYAANMNKLGLGAPGYFGPNTRDLAAQRISDEETGDGATVKAIRELHKSVQEQTGVLRRPEGSPLLTKPGERGQE